MKITRRAFAGRLASLLGLPVAAAMMPPVGSITRILDAVPDQVITSVTPGLPRYVKFHITSTTHTMQNPVIEVWGRELYGGAWTELKQSPNWSVDACPNGVVTLQIQD